jgi:hypothetical protein
MKSSAVLKPAGAHRRLDEPFWKLEGCERQSSDLGCRIVLRRHGDFPSPDAANHTVLHAASQHDQSGNRVGTIGCAAPAVDQGVTAGFGPPAHRIYVRDGSNCDIAECPHHGSFTPESRHSSALQYLTYWADCVAKVAQFLTHVVQQKRYTGCKSVMP